MYRKLLVSGSVIETYEYQKHPSAPPKRIKRRRYSSLSRLVRRKDNVFRLRNNFKRLVWANTNRKSPASLITLTMFEVYTVKVAWSIFTKFIQILRATYGRSFRYIAVPEFQKRGAVHFHALFWELPQDLVDNERDTRVLQRTWAMGFVDAVPTDGSTKLAHYLAKYMSKAMQDERLLRAKAYVSSRNCLRPVSIRSEAVFDLFTEKLTVDKPLQHTKEYDTKWLGRCVYKIYTK